MLGGDCFHGCPVSQTYHQGVPVRKIPAGQSGKGPPLSSAAVQLLVRTFFHGIWYITSSRGISGFRELARHGYLDEVGHSDSTGTLRTYFRLSCAGLDRAFIESKDHAVVIGKQFVDEYWREQC